MNDHDDNQATGYQEEWPIYVKRPDKRPEGLQSEYPDKESAIAALRRWQWWLPCADLMDEVRAATGPEEALLAGLMPNLNRHGEPPLLKFLFFFCQCHEWGVYPPEWIMGKLYEIFSSYTSDRAQGKTRSIGEYFGESRAEDRELVFGPLFEQALLYACFLEEWHHRKVHEAQAIVSAWLESKIQKDALPPGWRNDKTKGLAAIRKAHPKFKKLVMPGYREIWEQRPPSELDQDALLITLGADALTGHPDLLRALHKAKQAAQ